MADRVGRRHQAHGESDENFPQYLQRPGKRSKRFANENGRIGLKFDEYARTGTSGLADDPRFIQISAPVQPGNSGSPVLDSGGDIIGVVESKLDAEVFRTVGDIPENVNCHTRFSGDSIPRKNHVAYHAETTEAVPDLKVADVAARAKQFSLPIECLR